MLPALRLMQKEVIDDASRLSGCEADSTPWNSGEIYTNH